MRRWAVLRPHVEDGVLLSAAAREAGVPLRTPALGRSPTGHSICSASSMMIPSGPRT